MPKEAGGLFVRGGMSGVVVEVFKIAKRIAYGIVNDY